MAVLVRVTVPAPDDVLRDYGAGALIRLERAATEDGVYAEFTTKAVVDETYSYEIFDAAGSTTSWYKTRYSNALNTTQSEYSDPFSPGAPEAYANLDDLFLTMRQPTGDTRFWAAAERHLVETARDLDRELGYGLRVGTETETWLADGYGDGRLHVHSGIVSIDTIEIQQTPGSDWIELEVEGEGWILEGALDDVSVPAGEPFFHVQLIPSGGYARFPSTRAGVRLTGVPGWPAARIDAREANVAWGRQRLAADPSLPGGPVGPEEFGSPIAPDRWPRAVYDLITSERHRFWCHL